VEFSPVSVLFWASVDLLCCCVLVILCLCSVCSSVPHTHHTTLCSTYNLHYTFPCDLGSTITCQTDRATHLPENIPHMLSRPLFYLTFPYLCQVGSLPLPLCYDRYHWDGIVWRLPDCAIQLFHVWTCLRVYRTHLHPSSCTWTIPHTALAPAPPPPPHCVRACLALFCLRVVPPPTIYT